MMSLIEVHDVHVTYLGRKAEALSGVSFHIDEGETVLLLGPSGSGKSTLALCLNGLIPHALPCTLQGTVSIAGHETRSTSLAKLSRYVGTVFQDPEAHLVATRVEDEVAFGLENLCVPPEAMETRIRTALAQVNMESERARHTDQLSGGGKQRLAVASALALQQPILLFDEPTVNLDPVGTRQVFEAIRLLKQSGKYTLIVIEHKLDTLIQLVDRVIVLAAGGSVLVEGTPREVFRDHASVLLEQGVWMPQLALLAYRLGERGWPLDPFPLTFDEAVALWEPSIAARVHMSSRGVSPSSPAVPEHQEEAMEVRHLSAHYGTLLALDDLSLPIAQGDFLAIVGANGAGKTTLAQHLAALLPSPRGRIFLARRDITRLSARALWEQVGYVFQNPEHQFITDTVEAELRYGPRLQHVPEAVCEQRVKQVLDRFGLSRYASANPFTLSHGEKRRLSVATMLMTGQRILLLDEPTFGQDQHNATELLDLLKLLNAQGWTIVVITHDMTLVTSYARHVAVLAQGRLLFHGSPAALFAQSDFVRQAQLDLPSVAALAQRFARLDPAWKTVLTPDQFVQRAAAYVPGRKGSGEANV